MDLRLLEVPPREPGREPAPGGPAPLLSVEALLEAAFRPLAPTLAVCDHAGPLRLER